MPSVNPCASRLGGEQESPVVEAKGKVDRVRLPDLFVGVRVTWYIGESVRDGAGRIAAVYSDGTLDVDTDAGFSAKGLPFQVVRREQP